MLRASTSLATLPSRRRGYGETPFPNQAPDGAVDAKVSDTAMVRSFMKLNGDLDPSADANGFWMLFGTASVHGAPFVWSQSSWKWQKLRDMPDRPAGEYTLIPLHLK